MATNFPSNPSNGDIYIDQGTTWIYRDPPGAWQVQTLQGRVIGSIIAFPSISIPLGYMECDGREIPRADFPALFDLIGTAFGDGDGSTTFNIPDLRGEFIRGWDNGRGVDPGRALGSEQGDAIRNITGSITTGHSLALFSTGTQGTGAIRRAGSILQSTNGNTGGNNFSTGFDFDASRAVPTADENRPRNVALIWCIAVAPSSSGATAASITETEADARFLQLSDAPEVFHDPTLLASWRLDRRTKTLECWGQRGTDVNGNANFIFPKGFADLPSVTSSGGVAASGTQATFSFVTLLINSCTVNVRLITGASAGTGVRAYYHAIGEWDGVS